MILSGWSIKDLGTGQVKKYRTYYLDLSDLNWFNG